MISNYKDYERFIQAELKTGTSSFILNWFLTYTKPISRFLLLLRTSEFLKNCKPLKIINKPVLLIIKYLKMKQGVKLGFSIPDNTIDEGVQIPHYGPIVINSNARIAKNCRIHVCVNIGASGGSKYAPQIGNSVYIAPGVKIYGDIVISDRIAIAANSAVSKSFVNSDKFIGGVPAKELGNVDISKHIKPR